MQEQEKALKGQFKITIQGKEFNVRDYVTKTVGWAVKFADLVATALPPHAALPWSAVQFLLKVGDICTFQDHNRG
jgi:hypothetical protein